ncbi:hypothetical protein EDB84DRAFT_1444249 [Lactarius hengduanensis]|nr:hypothetical protein EDB84DRAFT_1444249 [Lactarius hengduanensis]
MLEICGFPAPASSGEGDLDTDFLPSNNAHRYRTRSALVAEVATMAPLYPSPASSTMSARQPRQRQPPKCFRPADSSSEDGDNEPPIVAALLPPGLAPVSSRATSPSRTSSPMPSQQERPQANRDLSDREKFDLHYEVTTKSLQEVLGLAFCCIQTLQDASDD